MNDEQSVRTDGLDIEGAKHRVLDAGEVRLHAVEAGDPKAPLVVLLHGFPEFWWSWRHQIPALAKAGFHVVAPDMRGYNLSDKPKGVAAYGVDHLVADVAGVIRACGESRAHIVGHDWGGAVAWSFAMFRPEMTNRLGILNCPHPAEMMRGLRTWGQLKKSWYMFFFQIPGLPERWLRKDRWETLRRTLRTKKSTEAEIDLYVAAAERAGGLDGSINYYRAMMRAAATFRLPKFQRIDAKTLVVWGEDDAFLGRDVSRPSAAWVPDAKVEYVPHATHWVQLDAPARVNELLIQFLRA